MLSLEKHNAQYASEKRTRGILVEIGERETQEDSPREPSPNPMSYQTFSLIDKELGTLTTLLYLKKERPAHLEN